MINFENKIFQIIYTAAVAHDSSVYVTTESANAPPSFPAVFVEYIDNYVPEKFIQSDRSQIFTNVAFSVHCYSNKASGKRQELMKLTDAIDDALNLEGYRRTAYAYNNLTDGNSVIMHSVARYEATLSADGVAYTS